MRSPIQVQIFGTFSRLHYSYWLDIVCSIQDLDPKSKTKRLSRGDLAQDH